MIDMAIGAGAVLFIAIVFLLLGWRLGRESQGKPMFQYPVVSAPESQFVDDRDPYDIALEEME